MFSNILYKIFFFCTIISFAFSLLSNAQGVRYQSEIFSSYQLQSNIQYGTTSTQILDIYTGTGDTASVRAMVLFIHGGGFKSGDKVSNFGTRVCGSLSRRGYLVASINYRLTPTIPDDVAQFEAMLRALQDAKAAVRFFRKNVSTYGIDTSQIFATGSSAGSITALHMAYLDSIEVPSYVNWANVGGTFEGTTGNPGFSSSIQGVISNWGAIGDTAWIHEGDVPVFCVHGTSDVTVYYDQIPADGPFLYGSKFIYARAQNIGLNSGIRLFNNTGHTLDNKATKQDSAIKDFSAWLFTLLHSTTSVLFTANPIPRVSRLHLNYPNPFNPTTTIEYELTQSEYVSIQVYDILGSRVASLVNERQEAGIHRAVFNASDLASDIYFYNLFLPENLEFKRMILLK
jgi:poly(3-hydroxybutyrate) depolymerase